MPYFQPFHMHPPHILSPIPDQLNFSIIITAFRTVNIYPLYVVLTPLLSFKGVYFYSQSQYTAASDIYSLGCVFWEIVTSRIPFDNIGLMEIMLSLKYMASFDLHLLGE